jgi:hypothetical protein
MTSYRATAKVLGSGPSRGTPHTYSLTMGAINVTLRRPRPRSGPNISMPTIDLCLDTHACAGGLFMTIMTPMAGIAREEAGETQQCNYMKRENWIERTFRALSNLQPVGLFAEAPRGAGAGGDRDSEVEPVLYPSHWGPDHYLHSLSLPSS